MVGGEAFTTFHVLQTFQASTKDSVYLKRLGAKTRLLETSNSVSQEKVSECALLFPDSCLCLQTPSAYCRIETDYEGEVSLLLDKADRLTTALVNSI